MSVKLLSAKHVDTLVGYYARHSGQRITEGEELSVSRKLLEANLKRYCQRYDEAAHLDAEKFRPAQVDDPVAIIKLCQCYLTNIDHAEEYAKEFVEDIMGVAISNLPGYAEAKWSL